MDGEYPPLTSSCVKNLVDRLFEKRKLAASEIERITREVSSQDKAGEIVRLIGYFSQDFILSPNPHTRKGGLLGLASVAIGLREVTMTYYNSIIGPVIRSFNDNDSRVRYYACETLYNVMKNSRNNTHGVLREVFDAISRGVADPDLNVRQGAIQCDRLLKEIVTEPEKVDHSLIVSLLRERIYSNNPHTRQFIVSWITALYAIPGLKVNNYLPQLLDGIFRVLGDSNQDIRRQCEVLVNDLLNEILRNPKELDLGDLINTLIVHCRLSAGACVINNAVTIPGSPRESPSKTNSHSAIIMDISNQSASLNTSSSHSTSLLTGEHLQQRTALTWIKAFVELDPESILPFASGIIGAVLPCFLQSAETVRSHRTTLETAVRINELMLTYAGRCESKDTMVNSCDANHSRAKASLQEKQNGEPSTTTAPQQTQTLNADSILKVTYRLLEHDGMLTRLAALRWVEVLGKVRPKEVLAHVVPLLPSMLRLLADPSEGVVHSVIRLVGNLCNHPETMEYLDQSNLDQLSIPRDLVDALLLCRPSVSQSNGTAVSGCTGFCLLGIRFLHDLIWYFNTQPQLLADRGQMIITDLCQVLQAEVVYRILSIIIHQAKDLQCAFVLVQALNRILLTQPSLHNFRNHLRAIRTEDGCRLLEGLYRAWCHNPVALLSLYLLTQNYRQCNRLIKSFGDLDMNVTTLVEMDQLIQLIESPIFATLRLHLLDKRYSADLHETLYCLLMCLPQTDAFHALWRRLQCVPTATTLSDWPTLTSRPQPDMNMINSLIPFDELFEYFHALQNSVGIASTLPDYSSGVQDQQIVQSLPSVRLNDSAIYVGSATDYLAQSLSKCGIYIPDASQLKTPSTRS